MISVIISTYNPEYFEAIKANIQATIGVEYEIIGVENKGRYSICEAYNIGMNEAKYPYLCFVHEDVILKTKNWGEYLISIANKDEKVGLIGVAGTKVKSTYPISSWGQSSFFVKYRRGHIFTLTNNKSEQHIEFDISVAPQINEDVVCIDGVFMFTKKEVFKLCSFDEHLFKNFHGYDLDFSLQIHFNSYRVLVDRNIELIHLSKGNYTPYFNLANKLINKKWKAKLPVASRDLGLNTYQLELYNLINNTISLKDSLVRYVKKIRL